MPAVMVSLAGPVRAAVGDEFSLTEFDTAKLMAPELYPAEVTVSRKYLLSFPVAVTYTGSQLSRPVVLTFVLVPPPGLVRMMLDWLAGLKKFPLSRRVLAVQASQRQVSRSRSRLRVG